MPVCRESVVDRPVEEIPTSPPRNGNRGFPEGLACFSPTRLCIVFSQETELAWSRCEGWRGTRPTNARSGIQEACPGPAGSNFKLIGRREG